jgi:hypothetical protein
MLRCVAASTRDLPRMVVLCCLTFELSGRQRQATRPGLAKMYRVPPDRAWGPAVGAPLERGVRPRCARARGCLLRGSAPTFAREVNLLTGLATGQACLRRRRGLDLVGRTRRVRVRQGA